MEETAAAGEIAEVEGVVGRGEMRRWRACNSKDLRAIWCNVRDVYLVCNGVRCTAALSLGFAGLFGGQLGFAERLELAIEEPGCSFRRHVEQEC